MLLLTVGKIASDELRGSPTHERKFYERPSLFRPVNCSPQEQETDEDASSCESLQAVSPASVGRYTDVVRPRTVSMSALELQAPHFPHVVSPAIRPVLLPRASPLAMEPLDEPNYIPASPESSPYGMDAASVGNLALSVTLNTRRPGFVGGTVEDGQPVRGVLRKKFSWKSYPELEAYLVENRARYLEFSSRLNYTSEQKRYNNSLTQGLLDLAAREGYLFEGFTFAAVRDRIRCYYKSYVQAIKKQKRKKRR